MTECRRSVAEIAARLGVNPNSIHNWITRKSMPVHEGGRRWKLIASELNQWVVIGLTTGEPIPKPIRKITQKAYARLAEIKKFIAAEGTKSVTNKRGKA